jgi:hypothetical protein
MGMGTHPTPAGVADASHRIHRDDGGDLKPAPDVVLGAAHPTQRGIDRPKEPKEQEEVTCTDALIPEVALSGGVLTECRAPAGKAGQQARPEVRVEVGSVVLTNTTVGERLNDLAEVPPAPQQLLVPDRRPFVGDGERNHRPIGKDGARATSTRGVESLPAQDQSHGRRRILREAAIVSRAPVQ